ncbi:unnamed protein product, partial [Mesorhabditis spiculigera]
MRFILLLLALVTVAAGCLHGMCNTAEPWRLADDSKTILLPGCRSSGDCGPGESCRFFKGRGRCSAARKLDCNK